jgi:predicted acyl esterase
MDTTLPTAATLYNYDIDRDAFPGLVIAKGGSGPNENDPTKYQAWRTPVLAAPLVVQGNVTVSLWSAMKDFDDTKGGAITVYLRDFDGSNYVELGGAGLTATHWQGGQPSWVLKTFQASIDPYTLAPGHSLELKLIVANWSDDDMWFAYDTGNRKSRINLPN